MARPRSPKKNTDVNDTVATAYNTLPPSGASSGASNGSSAVAVASPPTTETGPETRLESRKTPKKPEIVKNDPRANLVPINIDDEIRRFAYLLAERRGFEPGHESEDWLAAEREIRQRYRQQSA